MMTNVISASFQLIQRSAAATPTIMKTSAMIVIAPAVKQFVQRRDVVREPRDEPSDGIGVVERDRHALQVTEQLHPQVVHHLLRDDDHLQRLDVAEHEHQHENGRHTRR